MKKILYAVLICFVLLSCDVFSVYKETKYVYFSLNNTGQSTYKNIIVYAKDSNQSVVDSSSNTIHSSTDKDWPTVPNSKGVSVGIILANLKNIRGGVFEVQATMINGKLLSQEFGVIDGLNTRQKFKVDLKDSTILIR